MSEKLYKELMKEKETLSDEINYLEHRVDELRIKLGQVMNLIDVYDPKPLTLQDFAHGPVKVAGKPDMKAIVLATVKVLKKATVKEVSEELIKRNVQNAYKAADNYCRRLKQSGYLEVETGEGGINIYSIKKA